MQTLNQLLLALPQTGTVDWIGIRPARDVAMTTPAQIEAIAGVGLAGDRYASKGGKRQVTLIQAEHLEAIGSMLGEPAIDPARLRRNLVIRGLNLLALKGRSASTGRQFAINDCILEYAGLCHPCSRMETELGAGGYNAMRGHGGINARIVRAGTIATGSRVAAL